MKHKRPPEEMFLPFIESKVLDEEQGTFEGYLSVKNNVDLGNDRVKDGAFTKTIQSWSARFSQQKWMPFLWQHDPSKPIGGITELREDARGLFIKGFFDLDTQQGREAYSGFKKGYLAGLSMGYETIKKAFEGAIRDLLEVKLWEGSAATFPMNQEAEVTNVKTAAPAAPGKKEMEQHSNALQQALTILAQCIAMMPKCLGSQEMCDQCNAMIAQVMALIGQFLGEEMAESGEGDEEVEDAAEDFDLYERMEAIWRAVRALGTIQEDDWSYARYRVVSPRTAFVIVEDQQTDQYFKVPYSLDEQGQVVLGELQPVEMSWTPKMKARANRFSLKEMLSASDAKAGRRNSATDKDKITSIFDAATGLMDSEHMTACIKSLFGSLDDNQRADLLSALQGDEPGDKSAPAPGSGATGRHPGGDKSSHSQPGAALDPETADLARQTLELLTKAAGAPDVTTAELDELKSMLGQAINPK